MSRPPAHIDLWSDRALVVSQLGQVARHRQAAAALLIGLDGRFSIRWSQRWERTSVAFIPANLSHELACETTLMATLYLFPLTGDAEALGRTFSIDVTRPQVSLQIPTVARECLRAIHGGDYSKAAAEQWLCDAMFQSSERPPLDARVSRIAEMLRAGAVEGIAAWEIAEALGLSESRVMHLFSQSASVPMRRYRLWERMRLLASHVAAGESLTMAGLAAGFSDSSHLSHSFRDMFGIPASRVLNPMSRLRA